LVYELKIPSKTLQAKIVFLKIKVGIRPEKNAVIVFSAFAQIEGIRVFNLERHIFVANHINE
jgi:hypothetical protein